MAKGHRVSGRVVAVDAHHNGKHLNVSIAHGRRSPKPKGKDALNSPFGYDDRPRSNLVVPMEHAHKYRVGQRVHVAVSDAEARESEEDGNDGDDLDTPETARKSATRGLFNSTHRR